LELTDLVLEIQHSWGDRNINGNRFKLVHIHSFVRIQFKGITEIADGIMGGLHATPNMTADQFCDMIVTEYNLHKKKKYNLVEVLNQSMEDKVVGKDDKPLSLRASAEKTYGLKATEHYFQFSPKKDHSFLSNMSKAFKFKETKTSGPSETTPQFSVSSPQLVPKIGQVNFDEMPDIETIDKQLGEILVRSFC